MEVFDPAKIFKFRDALMVVGKQVFNFGFQLMFDGGPDVPVALHP